jgi:hypothetical protein
MAGRRGSKHMARWNGVEPYNAGRSALAFGPHVTIAVLALTAAIPGFAIVWLMSAPYCCRLLAWRGS